MERWKAIENTEGMILVSDLGRVKSCLRNPDGKILKQQVDNKGYLRVTVNIKQRKCHYKVHRLVASAFVENPHQKPQVNHINGNKIDNRACNLEWVLNSENARHAADNGLWHKQFEKIRKYNSTRKKKIVATNAETGEKMVFNSICDAQDYFGSKHITAVLHGKRKKAKGHTFEYADKGGELSVI